jgi:hypothetical protein
MKNILIISIAVLLLLSMSACQATPEKNIVIGKSLDDMIDKATGTQTAEETQAQGATIAEKVGAKDTYTAELIDAKGKVSIHVNADVQIPDTAGVSVQRVGQGEFSQAQVDVLMDKLMKGEAFSGDDFKLTKSEIQQQILEIQAALNQEPTDNDNDPKEYRLYMQDSLLAELQEQLATAPDTSERIPSTGRLEPMDPQIDYEKGTKLYALAQSNQGGYESLRVYNYHDSPVNMIDFTSEKNGFSKNMGYFWTKEAVEQSPSIGIESIDSFPEVTISQEDAKAQAEALIDALGVENLMCYSADKMYGGSYDMTVDASEYLNPRKCVWFLRYARSVDNVPVTYTVWDCMKVEEDAQSAPWSYEDMTFAIDDTGIVGFSWRSPYAVADTVTQDSNLISFDEVTSVFETMSMAVNAWDGIAAYNPNLTAVEIKVDHIKFGLTRITEQNKRDSGLLVPVWDFFGTMTQIHEIDGVTKEFDDGPIPILTINAIDGSIINRSLGY